MQLTHTRYDGLRDDKHILTQHRTAGSQTTYLFALNIKVNSKGRVLPLEPSNALRELVKVVLIKSRREEGRVRGRGEEIPHLPSLQV